MKESNDCVHGKNLSDFLSSRMLIGGKKGATWLDPFHEGYPSWIKSVERRKKEFWVDLLAQ